MTGHRNAHFRSGSWTAYRRRLERRVLVGRLLVRRYLASAPSHGPLRRRRDWQMPGDTFGVWIRPGSLFLPREEWQAAVAFLGFVALVRAWWAAYQRGVSLGVIELLAVLVRSKPRPWVRRSWGARTRAP